MPYEVVRVLSDDQGNEKQRVIISRHPVLEEAVEALDKQESLVGRGAKFCALTHWVMDQYGEPVSLDGVPF